MLDSDLPVETTEPPASKSQKTATEESAEDGADKGDEGPKAKRQKSENKSPSPVARESIAQKAARDGYRDIHDLMLDINRAVELRLADLRGRPEALRTHANDKAIAETLRFQEKAQELHRRESIYPAASFGPSVSKPVDSASSLQSNALGNIVLTTYGNAPQGKQLFSSLQHPSNGDMATITDAGLPIGVSLTRVLPTSSALVDRTRQGPAPTLGEVFAPARVRVPNQPPRKNSKLNVKGNVVTFYHPEEVERTDSRIANYYTQPISVGRWLDYSNAMPSSQIKTKQRERAQSLAGHRPSTSELEMTEMESLFRGAFSSFAPCKDDTGAMASSGLLGRMWWQRIGSRNFQRMIQAETLKAEGDAAEAVEEVQEEVDEDAIQDLIDHWDETNLDPSLDEVLGTQKKEGADGADVDVDEMLQVISDGLETLASFQRNRHLALPTSQDRLSSEPINGDMFMNGLITPPSEAETLQYEALKSQLKIMINMLPPYAVTRLNSDKLGDLAVSTKLPVHAEVYSGVMEEDDAAVRARQAQQTPVSGVPSATPSRPVPGQRPPVVPQQFSNVPLPQYVTQNRQAVPSPGYYTPTGQGQPGRQPIASMPRPLAGQPQLQPQRPGQQYRPNGASFPGYASQLAKAQTPFGHSNMNTYHSVQGSSRTPNYVPGMPQTPTPPQRYPSYPGGYPQAGQPTPGGYPGYMNGSPANLQQQRSASGQYLAQAPQYGQSPGTPLARHPMPPQQGAPQMHDPRRPYPPGITPQMQQIRPGQQPQPIMPGPPMGNGQYAGVGQPQLAADPSQRLMDQSRALAAANDRSRSFGDKMTQPHANGSLAGLAGIGLGVGATPDMQRFVAARAAANMRSSTQSPKPKPPPVIPPVVSPVPLPPIAQQISAVQQQLAAQARKEKEALAAQQAQAGGQAKPSTPTPIPPPVINGTAASAVKPEQTAAQSPAPTPAAAAKADAAPAEAAPQPPAAPAQVDVKPEPGQDQGGPTPMEGVTTST